LKAAAPQALLPSVNPKKTAPGREAAPAAARPARRAGDLFSRIVAAKIRADEARAARTGAQGAAQGQDTGHQGLQAAQLEHGAPDRAERDGVAAAKKRATRARGLTAEWALEAELGGPIGAREQQASPSSRQPEARADAASAAVSAAGRRGTEPRVFVLDLRRNAEQAASEAKAAVNGIQGQSSAREADGAQGALAGLRAGAGREATASGREGRTGRAQAGGSAAGPFESALERLRGMAGSELVKSSGIILRDGGGEIRLVLKPESLGSVRIRMNLVDNGIEGRIVVDNAAVKQVLDGSIDALTKALTAQGFQTASLEVAVGGQNAGGDRTASEPRPARTQASAEGFERNVPGIETLSLGELLVNLFV
jgi:hypothetical protein